MMYSIEKHSINAKYDSAISTAYSFHKFIPVYENDGNITVTSKSHQIKNNNNNNNDNLRKHEMNYHMKILNLYFLALREGKVKRFNILFIEIVSLAIILYNFVEEDTYTIARNRNKKDSKRFEDGYRKFTSIENSLF